MAPKNRTGVRVGTVCVAKDLVRLAAKTAAIREQKVQDYIRPVMARCLELIDAEICERGTLGVRDDRRKVPLSKVAGSTFIVGDELATEAASRAGMCITSVMRLFDPQLRRLLTEDYRAALVAAVAEFGDRVVPGFFYSTTA